MSGLFLNYFQVEVPIKTIKISSVSYSSYSTKESFQTLKNAYPTFTFYRDSDRILHWSFDGTAGLPNQSQQVVVDLEQKPKVLSKILESSILEYLRSLDSYRISKNRHTSTWEIISPKDLMGGSIQGLSVNRIIHFSPCYFRKDNRLLMGFSLSTSLKNSFTWSKADFERHGIDVQGLRSDGERIFANKQSLKRFLEARGLVNSYETSIKSESDNSKSFDVIEKFYRWIEKNKLNIALPFGLRINSIHKRYLPFEDELIKSEIIAKPQRYFYSNRKNTQGLRYYDQMVKTYQPFSLELYNNKSLKIGVICPLEYQGETEGFAKKIESKLKEIFHLKSISFVFKTINGKDVDSYKDVLYDSELLKCDLTYVVVSKSHEKLPPNVSPYHVCKAKLIGNGIPTQDVQIETIRQNLSAFTLTNISLNSYAKLGGTAWTIEKEDKLKDEVVVGVGSTVSENNQFVLGIAQIFHNDGRYMTGDCSPLSTFDNYAENLERHLYKVLLPLIEDMNRSGQFRLIFHLFKSASEKYEIKAINNLKERLASYNFEFALVHLAYGHNFRLYNNDGRNGISPGTYVQLSKHSALLHFVNNSDLPLKIDLDIRSTFTSLFYLSKQVYWFSHLSHRSYIPSKRTVTIMYPSLMARMTEELKKVDGWDYDRLKAVSEKLWFI